MKRQKNRFFKELMAFAGNYKYLTYLSLFLAFLSGIATLVPLYYIYLIVKEVMRVAPNFNEASGVLGYAINAFIFSIVAILIYFIALMCSHLAAFRVARNIRTKTIEHLFTLNNGQLENGQGTGRLRKIIYNSSSASEAFLAHSLPDFFQTILMTLALFFALFVVDYRLGLISLIPTLVSLVFLSSMASGTKMKESMAKYQNALEGMSNEAVEYIRGIPVVKTFNQTVYSFTNFKKSIDDYSKYCIEYTYGYRKKNIAFSFFTNSTFLFLTSFALILNGMKMTDATFILNLLFYIILTPAINNVFMKLMFLGQYIFLADDSMKRIKSILSLTSDGLADYGDYKTPNSFDISFHDVSFTYPGNKELTLKGINITCKENKITALVGPSGGGKSTIVKLLARFYEPNEGTISIGGIDVREIKEEDFHNLVSMVLQNSHLIKGTLLENLKLGNPNASDEEVKEALSLAQCDDIIRKLKDGLNTVIGTKGIYLSGGEEQRIIIARTILRDSKIIILDEATSFADPENEHLVQKAFKELCKNKTVIMIAHRLSTVRNVDKIYVIEKGEVKEEGSHDSLVSKARSSYKKMYNDYQKSIEWKVGN